MATAPGKSFRKGLTIVDLLEMFLTEAAARTWFEGIDPNRVHFLAEF
ncbi:MAG: hypothetical protein OXC17_11235 [Aestuariivita sp.]|nr:hypothetical protein [Aestuariivita sp.]